MAKQRLHLPDAFVRPVFHRVCRIALEVHSLHVGRAGAEMGGRGLVEFNEPGEIGCSIASSAQGMISSLVMVLGVPALVAE
jgi:hypothetical protein